MYSVSGRDGAAGSKAAKPFTIKGKVAAQAGEVPSKGEVVFDFRLISNPFYYPCNVGAVG
jgi:hypothetical protein